MARQFYKGESVTVRERVEASYSRYAGNPEQWLEPGMVATITTGEAMPCVTSRKTFYGVDFVGSNGETWHAGVHTSQLVRASRRNAKEG